MIREKPTARDGLLLIGLQVGIGLLYGCVLALLPINFSSTSWVPAVAVMIGAQGFGQWQGRQRQWLLTPPASRRLALWAVAGQLVLGIGAGFIWGAELDRDSLSWIIPVGVIGGGALTYVLTLLGFRTARRLSGRAARDLTID